MYKHNKDDVINLRRKLGLYRGQCIETIIMLAELNIVLQLCALVHTYRLRFLTTFMVLRHGEMVKW